MNTDQPASTPESSRQTALAIAIIGGFVAALLRIVPHPPNVSSVGALGLFGGARLRAWQAYLLPLGIMIGSDLMLWMLTGFDHKYSLAHLSRVFVYGSFMIYVLIGRCLAGSHSMLSITVAATLGGLQFFVLTNFCEWLFQPWQSYYEQIPEAFRYSRDWNGLVTCFAYALPFYQGEAPLDVLHDQHGALRQTPSLAGHLQRGYALVNSRHHPVSPPGATIAFARSPSFPFDKWPCPTKNDRMNAVTTNDLALNISPRFYHVPTSNSAVQVGSPAKFPLSIFPLSVRITTQLV